MDCPSCRHDNRAGARFCERCGAPLAASCAACGTALRDGARFCDSCGEAALLGSADASPSRRLTLEPRSYTPKHLADRILASKSALEGERKQVTVLFADVKGSLELAGQVDPEDWHGILNRFFEILTDGVHRFEGTVNQYTGDGIMALFGAPITHEDHAHRACYAALHLRESLREYSEELKRNRGLSFAVRMGIHSGEVVVGKIGDDLRMDYTAQGHTVGLAARLEQLADPGRAYVSEKTAAIVSGFFALRDLGAFDIKGVDGSLRVFDLEGIGEMRTRLDVSRARGLSIFVGRAEETAALERALARAVEGNAQIVGVVADAGIGKSRLCAEFAERCLAKGIRVREAHAVPHGRTIPFLPVLELMRGFFGVTQRDTDEEAQRKIAGTLALLDKDFTESLPLLFDFLGVPDPKRPLGHLDPEARQRQLFALVRQIVRARYSDEPGVLLFEDLHWLDGGSEAYLENIVESLPGTKGFLLLNFRPEYHAGWMQKSYYQQLPLHPLGSSEMAELLRHLLGSDPSLAGLAEHIRERTGGNPFFIEEVVQSLVESSVLAGVRGAYALTRPVDRVEIPASVQAVLGARIDRLPGREKQLLQSAAVIGKEFAEPVLRDVADLPEHELAEALRLLTKTEFIYEGALYPELEYAFKHPLTQEVAYRSQLGDRRARVHAGVARAIVELYPDRLDERAALLAHHWEKAGDRARAAHWHARAAGCIGVTDYREAFAHWRRVDELLREAEGTGEVEELRACALKEQAKLSFRVGVPEAEADDLFARGRTYFEARGDHRVLAELICGHAGSKQSGGHLGEYLALAKEAAALARRSGDPIIRAAVMPTLLWSLILRGSLAEALAAADETLALVGEDPKLGAEVFGWSPLITGLAVSGYALVLMGRLEEAGARLNDAFRFASAEAPPETLCWLSSFRMQLELARGDVEQALRSGRRSLEMAERSGSRFDAVFARCWMARAHVACGSWGEAVALLEDALDQGRANRTAQDILLLHRWVLALAHLGLGDVERARAVADEAIALCSAQDARVSLCQSHLARTEILRVDPRAPKGAAEADLEAAEQLVEKTGARLFLPLIHEEHARLARTIGDDARCERELREAHRLYLEMKATRQAERVAKDLEL